MSSNVAEMGQKAVSHSVSSCRNGQERPLQAPESRARRRGSALVAPKSVLTAELCELRAPRFHLLLHRRLVAVRSSRMLWEKLRVAGGKISVNGNLSPAAAALVRHRSSSPTSGGPVLAGRG